MKWQYEIIEKDGEWSLIESYTDIDSYAVIINGGESREDIVHMLQLVICDTFTDEEMRELDEIFSVCKEFKKLKGLV